MNALRQELKLARYSQDLDEKQVRNGEPCVFLPIIHYYLLVFSKTISKYVSERGFIMGQQNDYQFMSSVFNLVKTHMDYSAPMTLEQFFEKGRSEEKLQFTLDIISLVRSKHQQLRPQRSSSARPKTVKFKDEDLMGNVSFIGFYQAFSFKSEKQQQNNSSQKKARVQGNMLPTGANPEQVILSNQKPTPEPGQLKKAIEKSTISMKNQRSEPRGMSPRNPKQNRQNSETRSSKESLSSVLGGNGSSFSSNAPVVPEKQVKSQQISKVSIPSQKPPTDKPPKSIMLPTQQYSLTSNTSFSSQSQKGGGTSGSVGSAMAPNGGQSQIQSQIQNPPHLQNLVPQTSQDPQKAQAEFERQQIEKLSKQNQEMALIIANLNENVKMMSSKFDSFRTHMDKKVTNLEKDNYSLKKKLASIEDTQLKQMKSSQVSFRPQQSQIQETPGYLSPSRHGLQSSQHESERHSRQERPSNPSHSYSQQHNSQSRVAASTLNSGRSNQSHTSRVFNEMVIDKTIKNTDEQIKKLSKQLKSGSINREGSMKKLEGYSGSQHSQHSQQLLFQVHQQ